MFQMMWNNSPDDMEQCFKRHGKMVRMTWNNVPDDMEQSRHKDIDLQETKRPKHKDN